MSKVFISISFKSILLLFSVLLVPISFISVYGSVQNFSTDKSTYYDGDTILISGTVNYDPSIPSVILQIIDPEETGFAGIADISPKSDGSFFTKINVGGPTWSSDGIYTLKVFYGGNLEKKITYQKSPSYTSSESTLKSTVSNTDKQHLTDKFFVENPKIRITGFPSLDHSPQYYTDRYNNEPNYKSWFDSQFPNYSINDVVGYKPTHISDFPSKDHSPQYYIDRYNNEPNYKSWFDSQFPQQTIYDVLGFHTYIPDWIKTYAKLWTTGEVSDTQFMHGLDFMLKNKIIVIQNSPHSVDNSISYVPNWIRNNALWWADNLISQQEFVNSLKYLIEEDIIEIQ
ncbi:MAG: hypothetical protein HW410_1492 [Nitrosarchaeum sp.]|nr:hypothetical protein [Nitrosarchaeum sp.]